MDLPQVEPQTPPYLGHYDLVPPSEIQTRLAKLRAELRRADLDGALITERIDLFYFTGTAQDGWLWVPAEGEPRLRVRRDLARARAESPLDDVADLNGFDDLPGVVPPNVGRIGLELDVLPASLYLTLARFLAGVELQDFSTAIRTIRMVKSEYELTWMRRAAALNDAMFGWMGGQLREGMREIEIEAAAAYFLRSQGHLGAVAVRGFNSECFWGHVLSGPALALTGNAPGPTTGQGLWPVRPEGAGWRQIGRHEPICVDVVSILGGYVVDQARIYALGRPPDEVFRAQEAVLAVQDLIIDRARPGVVAGDLYDAAVELVGRAGLGPGFMGLGNGVPFIAHGVGLELDDWPVIGRGSKVILEAGMTFALEPKIALPGVGIGGIENTFAVTPDGLERLTVFPDDLVVI